MSLDYVNPGDAVRASTVNSLIDAVHGGGNMSPDLIVTGTRSGPQLVAPSTAGSTDLRRDQIFDVENYILSGWPMAKLKLGFRLQDALGAVRIHGEDGIENPVSAMIVSQNSANCPIAGGTLSTKVLGQADFAKDAAYGATGWMNTGMEGLHGEKQPRLEIWRTTSAAYEVFTNAAESAVMTQVSAAVAGGAGDQLSTLQKVDGWTLAKQDKLQGKATWRMTVKNGVVDIWNADGNKPRRAMLKAFLGCYETTSGGQARTSTWTWLVPMGSGAAYDDQNEGAWSTQCSYGGDPIFVECGKGELDPNYDGSAKWLTKSRWGTGLIAFGKFTSDNQGKIEPGNLWMDLAYDYQTFAVKGTLNDGSQEPPQGEALLVTSVKIAECASYKAKEDAQKGDEVRPSEIFQGTLGDLFMGTPKLDTYTPIASGVRTGSLDWTTRGMDDQGQKEGPVTCRCLQLKDFDDAEAVSADVSSDMWLVRRFDNQTSCADLVYVPVSATSVVPDSALSDAQTSSLEWRQALSGVSSDISVDVLQAWKFDQLSDVYNDLCIALSGQQQHVMLRNCETSAVEYLQLSCLSVIADSQGMSDQKSIGWLESDTAAPEELQLWNFDQAEPAAPDLTADMYLARRTTQTGPELVYLPLSTQSTVSVDIMPDSETSSAQTSSLQWMILQPEDGGGGGEGEGEGETSSETSAATKVLQAFNFEKVDQFYASQEDALSAGHQHVVLRNASLSAVEYVALSALSTFVDSDGSSGQKSVSWLSGSEPPELQLYGMDDDGETLSGVTLSSQPADILPEDYEFVVRKNGRGGEIGYATLKLASKGSGAQADGDDVFAQTSSLQTRELSSEDGVSSVLQLWDFEKTDRKYFELSDALSGEKDVVLRDCETSAVTYVSLSALSVFPPVDSEYEGDLPTMRSVQWGFYSGEPGEYLQLYGFTDDPALHDHVSVTLSSGHQNLLPDGCEFLVRTTDERGWRTLEYKSLSAAVAPGEAAVDSMFEDAQTSSLETRTVSSEGGVSAFAQLWNFDHMDQRWYQLSDALSGALRDVVLRDTETSSVRYIALSALSAGGVHPDADGESGQKSIDWLSGTEPPEIQLYGMDEDGETLSNVVLGETAVSLLPEDYEFVVRKNGKGGEIGYATVNASGLSSASSRFQFGLAFDGTQASIGEGAVQIGGYTYFSNGGTVTGAGVGTWWICVQCTLGPQVQVGFAKFASTSDLNYAQGDLTKYIFPLYKVSGGEVLVDYRPMPNAGCWEVSEYVSQGGS